MQFVSRIHQASRVSGVHFIASCAFALLASMLVLLVWYPYPYRELSGGRELFLLIIAVDVVCGPLLTLVLFSPKKTKSALSIDMALVVAVQLAALVYGLHSVWQARPLYLVLEIDRFKAVTQSALDPLPLKALSPELQVNWWAGPLVVGIREPKDAEERNKVMFDAVQGGRDYAERPEFYIPYSGAAAQKSLRKAKPLPVFLLKQPSQQQAAQQLALDKGADIAQWLYLPVVARQDWVAILDKQGQIQGFLKGDGF